MFDIWYGGIELTRLTIIFSIVVVLPVQLLLCFKVKRLSIRLSPIIVLSALAALFIVLWLSTPGWGGVLCAIYAIFVGFMIFVCGIGWAAWAIAYGVAYGLKKKHSQKL